MPSPTEVARWKGKARLSKGSDFVNIDVCQEWGNPEAEKLLIGSITSNEKMVIPCCFSNDVLKKAGIKIGEEFNFIFSIEPVGQKKVEEKIISQCPGYIRDICPSGKVEVVFLIPCLDNKEIHHICDSTNFPTDVKIGDWFNFIYICKGEEKIYKVERILPPIDFKEFDGCKSIEI